MLRFLKFLFTGSWHEHNFKIIKEIRCYWKKKEDTVAYDYVQQCQTCGKLQKWTTL